MIERIIVAGGGTGGHLFPGLAVVEEMRRREPELDVLFVGTARGIESRVLPRMGERLELLEVQPLMGRTPSELAKSVAMLPAAAGRAAQLIRRERPDLVLGVGGYASGPMLAAAAALGVPTAVLEQNAEVGMTNRLLGSVVGRAYVTFPQTAARFSEKRVRVVGNPVRRPFVDAARRALSDPDGFEARARTILVFGGSQGAKSLNEHVPDALARADAEGQGFRIVHQTGPQMLEQVRQRYRELGVDAEVVPFIDDMARAYAQAAVVISRAGATTVAEVCAVGRPSILVPYPHAANDHQKKNAVALEREGASICIANDALSAESMASALAPVLADRKRRRDMAEAARRFGKPEAAAAIVDDLCGWLGCREPAETPTDSEPAGVAGRDDGGGAAQQHRVSLGLRGQRPYVPSTIPPAPPSVRPGLVAAAAPRRPLRGHPSLLE